MKIIKGSSVIFLLLLIFFLVIASVYGYKEFRKTHAQLQGEIKAEALKSPVRVIRDLYAVPHISAKNTHDLLFAQGFVTAQDRMWQMDFSRRIAEGRLSEILGEKTVEVDYLFRTLEIREIAEKLYQSYGEETKKELEAYAAGVNHYINSGKKPLESIILGYDVEPWTPLDSISIHLLYAFDLSINMDEEIFALKALKKFGEEDLKELIPSYPESGGVIIPEIIELNLDFKILEGYKIARELFGLFRGSGASNSWVVSGEKSESGKPVLANDPHLMVQIPSVWYETHLKAPGINVVGATFPGSPYILIGHNERVAWGFTDSMADRIDLYIEKINPNNPSKYLYEDGWEEVRSKEIEIKVRGEETIKKENRYTKHGPLINSFKPGGEEALSMRWSVREVEDNVFRAISRLNRAKNIQQILEANKFVGIYALNMVFADVEGNIGYQLVGGVPIRERDLEGVSGEESKGEFDYFTGKIPVPGWNGKNEWKGFIPYDELPGSVNPLFLSIATANNRIVDESSPNFISNTYAPPYRYERIIYLLEEKSKLSTDDFKRIQADVRSIPARAFVQEILKVKSSDGEVAQFLDELSEWDYEVESESRAALFYEVARVNLIRNTFKDELNELYSDFLHTLNFNINLIDKIIGDPDSGWWDNVNTDERETRDEIIIQSIKDALGEIEAHLGANREGWSWGAIHKYRFDHPLGNVRFLGRLFTPDPVPAPGDNQTVNTGFLSYQNPYTVVAIPSYRFIVDLANLDRAFSMNSTGQSGNPLSPDYSDEIRNWAELKYNPLIFRQEDIEKNWWKELRLIPGK